MDRFTERAIVLSTIDYGEADRMVTLLTESRGKLSAFAGGARKSKRRFAGALEPGTLLRTQLVERQGTTYRLDAVDIERAFLALRSDLSLISRALYALELVRELTREQEPSSLFGLLNDYLEALDAKKAGPTSLLAFELSALATAGFMPRFDRCALCAMETGGQAAFFDAEHGGVVCAQCAVRVKTGTPILPELVRALRGLQEGQRTPLPPEMRRRTRLLLNAFIAHHLGRKLRSVEFLEQLGVD